MVIKRESKLKNKVEPKESLYEKISREEDEKKVKKIAAEKQKELDIKKETKRMEDIIFPYLDNLKEQISEKELWSFWVFPDRTGFKKYKNLSFKNMQKFIDKDPNKYKNRRIVSFHICTYHRSTDNNKYSFKNLGIRLSVGMTVMHIDKNGILNENNSWGCHYIWENEDFKTTKFSFKLLEHIMEPIALRLKTCTSLTGLPITILIKDLEKLKYNFSDVLNPLAGL